MWIRIYKIWWIRIPVRIQVNKNTKLISKLLLKVKKNFNCQVWTYTLEISSHHENVGDDVLRFWFEKYNFLWRKKICWLNSAFFPSFYSSGSGSTPLCMRIWIYHLSLQNLSSRRFFYGSESRLRNYFYFGTGSRLHNKNTQQIYEKIL